METLILTLVLLTQTNVVLSTLAIRLSLSSKVPAKEPFAPLASHITGPTLQFLGKTRQRIGSSGLSSAFSFGSLAQPFWSIYVLVRHSTISNPVNKTHFIRWCIVNEKSFKVPPFRRANISQHDWAAMKNNVSLSRYPRYHEQIRNAWLQPGIEDAARPVEQ